MNPILLMAESGSDITPEIAAKYGITLVPMHVAFGGETRDDGSFPVTQMFEHYAKTRDLPRTSGCTPHDFEVVFERVQREHPGQPILHLAYSAVTTCSYQNALLVCEDRPYVTSVDTKHVSVGQGAVVLAVKAYLDAHPDCSIQDAAAFAEEIRENMQMCFVPRNLDYLRAGGRVSNAAAMVGNLLGLHPCIEIIDGKLMAQKKYRGTMKKIAAKMIEDFSSKHSLSREHVYLIDTPTLEEEIRAIAEETVRKLGFKQFTWMKTGCVITCHGGPGALGLVGVREE